MTQKSRALILSGNISNLPCSLLKKNKFGNFWTLFIQFQGHYVVHLFIFTTALDDGHIFLVSPIYQKGNGVLER